MVAKKRKIALISASMIILIIVLLYSINSGSLKVSISELIVGLFTKDNETVNIIKDLRLPRVLIATISGFALALSALLLQVVTRNPIAEAGFLGISAGSECAYLLVLSCFPQFFSVHYVFSFLGGLVVACFLTCILILKRVSGMQLLLMGIAINSFLSGVNNIISSKLSSTMGVSVSISGLGVKSWREVYIIAIVVFLTSLVVFALSKWCNILLLPENTLHSLGINKVRWMFIFLVCAVILSSITVAIIGTVSFIGLLVAHISRKLIGNDYVWLFPFAGITGAWLLLLADTLGRTLFLPAEISANNLMLIIGGCLLLCLFVRGGVLNSENE